MSRIPVIVALQDQVSGVLSWALRLRDVFEGHPRYRIQLLLFGPEPAPGGPRYDLHAGSERDLERLLKSAGPAIIVPNWLYFMFPICARLVERGGELRIVGFCRADDDEQYYNPLHWCEPLISEFVAVSPECQAHLAGRIPARAADIHCLPTGVNLPESLDRTYQTAPIRLVYGGRVTQLQKRVMDFVPLVAALYARGVDFRFHVYGDGDHFDKLRDAMRAADGEGRVRFHGRVEPDRMPDAWAAHDVFVQTSDFEGTSNSMLESMAQGAVPVLTRTKSGIDAIVRDGENGFIVDVGDMESMAERVQRLASTPGLLERMGRSAHATAAEYSMDRYRDRFAAVLDRVWQQPVRRWPKGRPYLPEGGVYRYRPGA